MSLMLMMTLLLPAAAQADIIEIAPDVSKCPEPQKDGLKDEMTYEDPSISVRIETGKMFDTKYYDFGNVPQPGFWLIAGASYRFHL